MVFAGIDSSIEDILRKCSVPWFMPAQLGSLDGTATNTKRVQRKLPMFNHPVILHHMQKTPTPLQ
jgi:hypothetical protein